MRLNVYNRIAAIVFATLLFQLPMFAQMIVVPDDEPSFISEYVDGEQWAYLHRDGYIVGITNQKYDNDYGNFYQIKILIQNLKDSAYTFDPTTIRASVIKDDAEKRLKLYSYADYQKKIKRSKTWNEIWTGLAIGLSSNPNDAYTSSLLYSNQTKMIDKLADIDAKIHNENYLKKNTIHAGEGIYGYMNIKRVSGKSMLVVVPIDGVNYVFEWDLTKKAE